MFRILAVNPGSTSTKIGCFEDDRLIFEKNIAVDPNEAEKSDSVSGQCDKRFESIRNALAEAGIAEEGFDAAAGRGGLLAPVPGGTYLVSDGMKDYLRLAPRGAHASNLGAFLAEMFAKKSGAPAFIVDPVSVDELWDVARISGAPEIERESLVHALNQKAVARAAAEKLGKKYEECRFVVAHLGTGITIGAHCGGRIVDLTGGKADGPFSAERAGALPADALAELCFSGRFTHDEMRKKLISGWGIFSYLGTKDLREAFSLADRDGRAASVMEAFAYQIAKGIGEMAAALGGELDAVILTGGMAHSERLLKMITGRVKFLGRIETVPGEDELKALVQGALRVLRGEERARRYPDGSYL